MKHKRIKQIILSQNSELRLNENGDFSIEKNIIDKYEIIDFHCHIYKSLSQLFPPLLQKEKNNDNKSLMDLSCFPFSIKLFDLDKIYFSGFPKKLFSIDGFKTKSKLFTGAFVINYATKDRLLKDMDSNGIAKAVVHQINPPNKSCAVQMEDIVLSNNRILTFGSIHPYDENIDDKIKYYMYLHIKGWKLNPHVWGVDIDCDKSMTLIRKLSNTGLPILCCSGIGLPKEMLLTKIPSSKTKKEVLTQSLDKFEIVFNTFQKTTFILAHSGCFEFDRAATLLQKYNNVHTDISIQPASNIKMLIDKIGSERILFGTDYPFVTQAFSILSVLRSTSNEKDRKNIFSENAKKLLNEWEIMSIARNHSYSLATK